MHLGTKAGRLFHSLGPETKKARLTNFGVVRITAKSLFHYTTTSSFAALIDYYAICTATITNPSNTRNNQQHQFLTTVCVCNACMWSEFLEWGGDFYEYFSCFSRCSSVASGDDQNDISTLANYTRFNANLL